MSKPETPKRCGVCGSVLKSHRVYMRPDGWVCVKSGCPAWRWDGEPAPKAEAPVDKPATPAPVSEPPIDWAKADDDATATPLNRRLGNLCRAYRALKAQNATLTAEVERLRDLIVAPIEARLAFDRYSDSSTTTDAMWHALCNAKIRAVDALSDEGKAIRAAREAGKS